jgi:hypothetical protein
MRGDSRSPVCGVALGVGGALMTITGVTELHQPVLSHGLVGVLGGAAFIIWGAWLVGLASLGARGVAAICSTLISGAMALRQGRLVRFLGQPSQAGRRVAGHGRLARKPAGDAAA